MSRSLEVSQKKFGSGFFKRLLLKHRKELIYAHLIAILATVIAVPLPLLLPVLVDEVLLDQPGQAVSFLQWMLPDSFHSAASYIVAMTLLSIVLRIASMLLNVWQSRQLTIVSKDLIYRMRMRLLKQLRLVSMKEYESIGSGGIASRFVTDLDTIDRFVSVSVSRLLVAVLTIIGTAVILLWMHWQLALFILFLNPVVIYCTMILGKQVKTLKKRENSAYEAFQQALTETLDAVHQIRIVNREQFYYQRIQDLADAVKQRSITFEWRSDAASRFSFNVFLIGFDMFRMISMLMVIFSDLSIGQMFAVFGYLWFMMGPVQEILNMQYAYYSAKAALQRINTSFDLEIEPQVEPLANPFKQADVRIDVDDAVFGYHQDKRVLNHVSFSIEAGERVAFVGASGGGKSTLVQLLTGMYPLTEGDIRFNGRSISDIGWPLIRENVCTVIQTPALFNATVRMNLDMGIDYSDQQLWQALQVAQLDDVVKQLPDGLDTVVGRNGIRLSGGQRQRLAIARMVLMNPKVVILDESTSALDTETEANLHDALSDFLKGRTTIIIAHRLSAVKQADRIFVFHEGRICEEGNHQSLVDRGGLYANLYGERQLV
ncbi:ABC transporter ATP-binding protein [Litoribrevibacter albus]|uniref:ABC transporter ATP-binding protein n=1 Tax=Litoribrevibacter albus TaxID=1473156 RepID=UPI0024E0C94A|nr:ABC transporter ATP-binding protein [Litoribrevibacter albus]